jgi:hypothetical protein
MCKEARSVCTYLKDLGPGTIRLVRRQKEEAKELASETLKRLFGDFCELRFRASGCELCIRFDVEKHEMVFRSNQGQTQSEQG